MREELDFSVSKKPYMVPDGSDVRVMQAKVQAVDRVISDTKGLEKIFEAEPHQQLVLLARARVFDIVRQMLSVDLTTHPDSVALNCEARGRLREQISILDDLEGVRAYGVLLQEKKQTFIGRVKALAEKIENRRKKE